NQGDADALLGGAHHSRHGVEAHQSIRLDRLDPQSCRPAFPRLAALFMQQQRLAVQIAIRIDWVVEQKRGRTRGDEVLREQLVHDQSIPGPAPTTMDRSASGGWVLGAENVVSMRMSVSSRA